jgi:hypothetical protein
MLSARALTHSMIAAGFGRSDSLQSRDLVRAIANAATPSRRSIRKLLLPLIRMASNSEVLLADSIGCWRSGDELFFLPRFIFQRTLVAKPRIEVGIFAALDGNDLGAIRGMSEILWALNAHPAIGREYRLWLYPLCDPVGYVDHTGALGSKSYPIGELWKDADTPETQLIRKELGERRFDGVILLRGDPLATRLQARVRNKGVDFVTPALIATEQALRNSQRTPFPGYSVHRLNSEEEPQHWPGQSPRLFEIVLEIPATLSLGFQGQLFLVALHAILAAYRRLTSETGSELLNE